jgi:hypothetical protein
MKLHVPQASEWNFTYPTSQSEISRNLGLRVKIHRPLVLEWNFMHLWSRSETSHTLGLKSEISRTLGLRVKLHEALVSAWNFINPWSRTDLGIGVKLHEPLFNEDLIFTSSTCNRVWVSIIHTVIIRYKSTRVTNFRLYEIHKLMFSFQSASQFSVIRIPSSRKPIVVPGASSRVSSVPEMSPMRRTLSHLEQSAQTWFFVHRALC